MNAYGDMVTRVRAPLVDGYGGQQIRDWDSADTEEAMASVQSSRVVEQATGREVITTDKTVNTALEFVETDRCVWRGSTYEITGVEPHYMTGRFDHYEVTMTLIEEPTE